jgi:DNA-binding transcriptional ArsR family regulator
MTPHRYVMLYHWMMKTDAWRDLDPAARAIYLELERRYNGQNNGLIHYSVREAAADVKVSKSTASRALDSLQSHGFIAIEKRGRFSLKIRHATEYRLTIYDSNVEGIDYAGKLATKDFVQWPNIQNPVPLVRLTGRAVKLCGPHGETASSKNTPDGLSGETVKANSE